MPGYYYLVERQMDAKHDAAAVTRVPMAAFFGAAVAIAGLTAWLIRGDGILAVLTALLVAAAPGVLRSATILRPESAILFTAFGALYTAEAFGRSKSFGVLLAAILLAVFTIATAYIGAVVIPAAIISIVAAHRGSKLAWGHLTFAILFAAVAALTGARILPLYSPAVAAAAVFLATLGHRPIALVAAVACLCFVVPWAVMAQRQGHDFASLSWKHSETMRTLVHLPKDSIFYSNAPEAVELHDRHVVHPIPDDDAGRRAMDETLTHRESFIVWFNAAPGDFRKIDSNAIEEYEALPDGALYRASEYAWQGKNRRVAFNPDTPSLPARRAGGRDQPWNKRHAEYVARAAKGGINLLFLGDSITDDYRSVPGAWEFFQQRYGPYHPADFGIDGDHTQHLLYRIEAGECDHISPKVAVILIGTNNTADDSAKAIARGITACVQAAREKMPKTRILLLGLFPRGFSPMDNDKRPIIQKVNQLLAPLDNGDGVRFLNLYDRFLEPDGTLRKDVMYDGLHPSLKGYHIWADAMQPLLDEMMHAPPLTTTKPTTRSN